MKLYYCLPNFCGQETDKRLYGTNQNVKPLSDLLLQE